MPKVNVKDFNRREKEKRRIVSLTITSDCNLSCKYCYEKHSLRNNKIMDISVAKNAICQYMEEDGVELVEIDFFGGEPLLGFDFIRDLVEWFHTKTWNKRHIFFIGTNGTILTESIREWLYKNRQCVQVGLSLDGNKTAHDLCRSNSYDIVQKNLPFFLKHWPHQACKMTVCADTVPYMAEGIIELEEKGILFTANIAFENHWSDDSNKEKLLRLVEDQLARLVDYYEERPYLYPVSPLLTSVPDYLGIPSYDEYSTREIKRFCGAGHEMVVIDVDGTRYPCHRFIPWVTKKESPVEKVNCQTAWKPDQCSKCKLIHSCPTCAGYNWEMNGDTGHRTTFHCESFKLEVMASCVLEWKRLRKKLGNKGSLTNEEVIQAKTRVDAIGEFIENPV
jgi:uncharacterized protein